MTGIRLSMIAAVAANGVIGAGGKMPWRLSTDMKRFRRLTMGKPVIMGRKTFASIGKALEGRVNVVVTRQADFAAPGTLPARSLEEAMRIAKDAAAVVGGDEVMVLGGGEVYAAALPLADRLYITHVDATPEGDVRFPPIDPGLWHVSSRERFPAGEKDSAATTFAVYDRRAADEDAG